MSLKVAPEGDRNGSDRSATTAPGPPTSAAPATRFPEVTISNIGCRLQFRRVETRKRQPTGVKRSCVTPKSISVRGCGHFGRGENSRTLAGDNAISTGIYGF